MKFLKDINNSFLKDLNNLLKSRFVDNLENIDADVKTIINDVIKRGDEALYEYSKKFDKSIINKSNIKISNTHRKVYKDLINKDVMNAFDLAIKNITNFHNLQYPKNYEIINKGIKTSSLWKPIQSVGLYIPGGSAVYPSSLIMNSIPAIVAGVERVVVVTPPKLDSIDPYILALLDRLEIDEVYQVGGAHAIAALAYGTESIKPVDKIFGPGNSYVASAKKQVFGKVGIDLIAGPSEIVVVADKDNNPEWVASDLIAQAEHDEKAQSILITDNENFANKVIMSIDELTNKLSRKKIIKSSLDNYGIVILVSDILNASEIINIISPEHLHLQNKLKNKIFKNVNNAGGIFLGEYSSEAFGDYIVGTNHILPTSGSAKFSSGLGVLDFMKRTSVVEISKEGSKIYSNEVSRMTEIEKLDGHKLSVKIRQIEKK